MVTQKGEHFLSDNHYEANGLHLNENIFRHNNNVTDLNAIDSQYNDVFTHNTGSNHDNYFLNGYQDQSTEAYKVNGSDLNGLTNHEGHM